MQESNPIVCQYNEIIFIDKRQIVLRDFQYILLTHIDFQGKLQL